MLNADIEGVFIFHAQIFHKASSIDYSRFNGVVYQLKFSSEYKLVRDKMSCIFVRAEDEVVPQSLESFQTARESQTIMNDLDMIKIVVDKSVLRILEFIN